MIELFLSNAKDSTDKEKGTLIKYLFLALVHLIARKSASGGKSLIDTRADKITKPKSRDHLLCRIAMQTPLANAM